nr:MAG TPA: PcfJ like protein [Caudoviricetes sp.]
MQIAQVTIPQMFASYATASEDYTPDELIFRCMHCRHDFRIPTPRGGICASVFITCPHCKTLICYGISNDDNIWARYDKVAPVTMHLYLYEFKDFVKLLVCGRGLFPAPRGSVSYWREVPYKEEFRFDTQRRKTTWKQSIGESHLQRELCDPKELVELGQESVLRYLFSHYSIAKHKSEILSLLRTLRETVREKLERRVGHKVSSFFCPASTSAGWLLLPIGNIAYRMVFKDAANLPAILRQLNTGVLLAVPWLNRFPEHFDVNIVRRAADTVTGLIAAASLPDTRSVRRALTEDTFCLRKLVFLHQLFGRSDLAMQAFPLFGDHAGEGQRRYPIDDTLMRLKEFYTDAEILRFLRRAPDYAVRDTLHMLNLLGEASYAELQQHPPKIRDLHDTLVALRHKEEHPDYTFDNETAPIRRRLAMQQDRVQFFLPDCSRVLYDAGKTLHNCVGSYAQEVRQGHTHIVLMSDDRGKLIACIEVADGRIKQAKLDCNRSVSQKLEVNAEIIAWAEQVGVRYDACSDIDTRPQTTETTTAAIA